MSDDEPQFRLEVEKDLSPEEKAELEDIIRHLLKGGSVVYLDHFATPEDQEKLREFVEEGIRGGDNE